MLSSYKKNLLLVVLSVVGLFCFSAANAQTLGRALKVGSSGADVKLLQQWLNGDPDTQISGSGTGSPGKESTYFGPATSLAVQKFQLKYGLVARGGAGYGQVGPKTLKKLVEVFSGAPAPSADANQAAVKALSKVAAKKITTITGALTGIAPDKSEFNVKIGKQRYDYTILLDGDTQFIGKDGAPTNIDDFGFGDQIQVKGVVTKAYTLQAVQVHDLTSWKIPVKQTTMTINNISVDESELVANDGKQDWHIKIQPQTSLMNEDRTAIQITDLTVGDTIYVAGVWNQHSGIIFGTVVQKK